MHPTQTVNMEPMTVTIISVVQPNGQIRVRARATAQDATILIEVRFDTRTEFSVEQLEQIACDENLRYLDIA